MFGNCNSPYIADRKLIPRMKMYINSCGSKPVILSSMVDTLQQTYNDYRRKKRQAFAKSVEKAYSLIKGDSAAKDDLEVVESLHQAKRRKKTESGSQNIESDGSDSSIEEIEYLQNVRTANNSNFMNSSMTNLYGQNSPNKSQSSESRGWVIDKTPSSSTETPFEKVSNSGTGGKSKRCKQRTKSTNVVPSAQKSTDAPPENSLNELDASRAPDTDELVNLAKEPAAKLFEDSDNLQSGVSTPVREIQSGVSTPVRDPDGQDAKSSVKSSKKVKKKPKDPKKEPEVTKSSITFADVGGQESTLKEICKLLVHMRHPEVYVQLGVTPPRGFLLHGPPGCGKTLLASAIAGELELPFIKIASTELVSGVSGESEEKIRDLFERAMNSAPCILFLDEIDAITPKRENASKDMERRIVSQLLTCMDDLNSSANTHVLVIGATNRPDSLDPALRRAGRFDREISLGIPDERAREGILRVLCRGLRLDEPFNFSYLAKSTPGFVGADLTALAREAAMTAVNRVFDDLQLKQCEVPPPVAMETDRAAVDDESLKNNPETIIRSEMDSLIMWLKEQPPLSEDQLQSLSISMADFESALKHVQPSAKREGFATIPDVTWDDIGALKDIREELEMAILAPVHQRETFQALGLKNPPGILLAGPPGCGKTLLAKAIANESGINFISVKGPELLNMYVGESERAVRQVFLRARNSAPCVIFFDELDSICPKRSSSSDGGSSTRVVNQLLTEMDGLEERKQVFIMGATNRPDIIDPAILRPGRLDKILYVGLPAAADREEILRTITKNGTVPQLTEDVDLKTIADDERIQGFTGADLAALVRESSMAALREFMNTSQPRESIAVNRSHFETAFAKVRPSVSKASRLKYENMKTFTSSL